MNQNTDLFADMGPEFSPKSDRLEIVAGKVVARTNKPSAAQKRFNTLMQRVEAAKEQELSLRRALDTHMPAHAQTMRTLLEESQRMYQALVLLLHERIQGPGKPKGLTPNQKEQATALMLELMQALDDVDDPQIAAVRQQYQPQDNEVALDESQAQKDLAQELLDSYVGEDFAQGRSFDSPEAVLEALLAHEQQKMQAREDKRKAKQAQRKAQKGPSAREQAAEQKQLDAHNALRTVFRQLASALHPDREPDAQQRARKTALMSEVNAAYERQDLNALLRLQLQTELVDASKAAILSEEKLKAMCHLLSEQVKAMEMDIREMRISMEYQFGYPSFAPFDEKTWLAHLREDELDLENQIAQMRADQALMQEDKAFKAWLKEQYRGLKAQRRLEESSMDIDDFMLSMLRRGL